MVPRLLCLSSLIALGSSTGDLGPGTALHTATGCFMVWFVVQISLVESFEQEEKKKGYDGNMPSDASIRQIEVEAA